MPKRLFLALIPTPQAQHDLDQALISIQERYSNGRALSAESRHITLHFLGNVSNDTEAKLIKHLSEIKVALCHVTLDRWRGFPKSSHATVLALMDTHPHPAVLKLHQEIELKVKACGIDVQSREWIPHLTVLRFKDPIKITFGCNMRETISPPLHFSFSSFALVESRPGATGSIYTVVKELGETK